MKAFMRVWGGGECGDTRGHGDTGTQEDTETWGHGDTETQEDAETRGRGDMEKGLRTNDRKKYLFTLAGIGNIFLNT